MVFPSKGIQKCALCLQRLRGAHQNPAPAFASSGRVSLARSILSWLNAVHGQTPSPQAELQKQMALSSSLLSWKAGFQDYLDGSTARPAVQLILDPASHEQKGERSSRAPTSTAAAQQELLPKPRAQAQA